MNIFIIDKVPKNRGVISDHLLLDILILRSKIKNTTYDSERIIAGIIFL